LTAPGHGDRLGQGHAVEPGAVKLAVELTPKARARLKRQKRKVAVAVKVTFTSPGTAPLIETLSLALRR
jgi:hypothetical protein